MRLQIPFIIYLEEQLHISIPRLSCHAGDPKLLELIKFQNFYIDHFLIWESWSKQYSPNLESHINYMKLYVRIVDSHLHLTNTLSIAKIFYIWNVDIDEWNNIGIHEFSSPDHLGFWKSVRGYEFFINSKLTSLNFFKWKVDH